MRSFHLVSAASVTFLLYGSVLFAQVPRDGLQLWLSNDDGLMIDRGLVSAWKGRSEHRRTATAVERYKPPQVQPSDDSIRFSPGRLLHVTGPVLPAESRELTVVAVGRADTTPGVGFVANRSDRVPLIQLDVDENGMARFIVRDRQNRTLRAVVPAALGRRAVYIGILKEGADSRWTAGVQFNQERVLSAASEIELPITSADTWIGGLPLGNRLYSLNGTMSEVLIFDRALNHDECDRLVTFLRDRHDLGSTDAAVADSFNILAAGRTHAPASKELQTDVCVVGGGSGGIGTAIAAARRGVRVVLIERQRRLGGTGTNAFVSCWEPGPGCSIAEEIYERMRKIPGATGVATRRSNVSKFSLGQWYVQKDVPYSATLTRAGRTATTMASVPYHPRAFDQVVRRMLSETGRVTILDRTTFFRAETNGDKTQVESVLVEAEDGTVTRVRAKVVVDCTGDAWVCRSAGCKTMLGVDSRRRFNESAAPEKGIWQLNAISRCYRIRRSKAPVIEPEPIPSWPFPHTAHVTGWEDGDRIVNPLPMLPGRALIDLGYDECMRRSEKIAHAHWHWLQQQPEFAGYELDEIAPMLGIRESYRVVTEYVLQQEDLERGLKQQTHSDIIAVADHPCDIHGAGGHLTPVTSAYGIPYRCLIPQGDWGNLLVACRGAGFSKIAASSCRLQRTIIQLGHAAGVAAAMSVAADCPVDEIDVDQLVRTLNATSRYPVK